MKIKWIITALFLGLVAGSGFSPMDTSVSTIYNFSLPDIDGKMIALGKYKSRVLLIVNVASKCGLTPQYEGLQKIYQKYREKGFEILAFPANNFLNQEPGSNLEIKEFCTANYGVEFPLFSKISVKGSDIHPLYRFLTAKETNPKFSGDIRWNFDKFLVDKRGRIIARFHPRVKPEDPQLIKAIEQALQAEI
jgi:glutathione peroxidase